MENFLQGVHSTVFHNAPAGLIYPGDAGFPQGQTGLNVQWWNLSPRGGVAWDARGDGRLAVRSLYSTGYDFMPDDYLPTSVSARPPSSAPVWVSRMVEPSAKTTLLKRPTGARVLACQT